MNRAVGIIPARWDSTRFPGKPLYLIAGKPLLRRVWEQSMQAKKLDSVIIATDDMRIGEAAFDWGAEVALTSPKHHSGTDRVAEVAKKAKEFAYIINIQGDEPLVDPRLISSWKSCAQIATSTWSPRRIPSQTHPKHLRHIKTRLLSIAIATLFTFPALLSHTKAAALPT